MILLKSPLTPFFGVLLLLSGLYSLKINAAVARAANHQRAAKIAIWGGWLYILGGSVLIVLKKLF